MVNKRNAQDKKYRRIMETFLQCKRISESFGITVQKIRNIPYVQGGFPTTYFHCFFVVFLSNKFEKYYSSFYFQHKMFLCLFVLLILVTSLTYTAQNKYVCTLLFAIFDVLN